MMQKIQWISVIVIIMLMVGSLTVSVAIADEKSVVGTIIKTEAGDIVLLTDPNADRYMLESNQDLSDMVGKYVQVTGTVEENAPDQSIQVEFIENADMPTGP